MLHGLPQFIEYAKSVIEKRTAINCRFDTLRTAIEKTRVERMLQISYRF